MVADAMEPRGTDVHSLLTIEDGGEAAIDHAPPVERHGGGVVHVIKAISRRSRWTLTVVWNIE
jgi:hypothetical protein